VLTRRDEFLDRKVDVQDFIEAGEKPLAHVLDAFEATAPVSIQSGSSQMMCASWRLYTRSRWPGTIAS
jgi:hypothetical protein